MDKKLHYQPSSPTIRLGNPTSTEPPISLGRGFAPYSGMSASKLLPTIMKAKMLVLLMLLLSISGITLLSSCGGDATEENHPTLSELDGTWTGKITMKANYFIDDTYYNGEYPINVTWDFNGSSYHYSLILSSPKLPTKLKYLSNSGTVDDIFYATSGCSLYSITQDAHISMPNLSNYTGNSFDMEFSIWDRDHLLSKTMVDMVGKVTGTLNRTAGTSNENSGSSDNESYTITSVKAVKFSFTNTGYSNYTTVNMYKWILHTQNNKVVLSTSNTDTSKWMVASKNTYKTLGNYNVSSYTYYVKHYVGVNSGYYYFFN